MDQYDIKHWVGDTQLFEPVLVLFNYDTRLSYISVTYDGYFISIYLLYIRSYNTSQ